MIKCDRAVPRVYFIFSFDLILRKSLAYGLYDQELSFVKKTKSNDVNFEILLSNKIFQFYDGLCRQEM